MPHGQCAMIGRAGNDVIALLSDQLTDNEILALRNTLEEARQVEPLYHFFSGSDLERKAILAQLDEAAAKFRMSALMLKSMK